MAELGSTAPRYIARMLFGPLVQEGFSANQALGWLKTQGLGYNRQQFLQDWKITSSNMSFGSRYAELGRPQTIPKELYTPAPFHSPQTYRYVVRIEGTDLSTGKYDERFLTIMNNNPLTLDEIISDAAVSYYREAGNYGDPNFDIDNMELDYTEVNIAAEI